MTKIYSSTSQPQRLASSSRRMNCCSLFVLFLVLADAILVVSGQGKMSVDEDDEQLELDLESMSDAELELICVERGFELVRDPSLGDLTHQDFVDAASRCLAIEKDMNDILNDNPDLAKELLDEIDHMKEEKERLEAEQKEMLAQKERLEQQLKEKNQQKSSMGEGTRMWGSALDGSLKDPKQSTSTKSSSNAGSTLTEEGVSSQDEAEEEDPCNDSSNSTSAATQDDSSKSADFSLKGFLQEVFTEFEKDVTRFTSLILPVLKPVYNAGNKAWNYVKWVFRTARQHYQKYAPKQEQPSTPKREKVDPIAEA